MNVSYRKKLSVKIKQWGPDSPVPNILRAGGFRNTYPYNYRIDLKSAVTKRSFEAMVLENEYLRVTVVPELGARIFSIYDTLLNRVVFEMTDVISPILILLRGVYMPIGLELNFPSGHTVHAVEPIPCQFAEEKGSRSIRMSVFNAVTRIHTLVTVTLVAGERRVRISLTFKNTLPIRNGFMYWDNTSVAQTPELTFQCKAPMCHFFMDYSSYPFIAGKDLRICRNRRFASDLFAIGCPEKWFGFYEPNEAWGAVHISPDDSMKGKKHFTWGFDEYGFRWGQQCGCGKNGYVEFQAGILETQSEYLHLEPFEEKTVNEAWLPYNGGYVDHATEDFIFIKTGDRLMVTPSKHFSDLRFLVRMGEREASTSFGELSPGDVKEIAVPDNFNPEAYELKGFEGRGRILVDKAVRAIVPANKEEIRAKQDWLELRPRDDESRLEVAWRLYKSRQFAEAQKLAKQVASGPLAGQAAMLLAEIGYVQNYDSQMQEYAKRACDDLPEVIAKPVASVFDHTPGYDPEKMDSYSVVAQADALYQSGRIEAAAALIDDCQAKTGKENICLSYCRAYLAVENGDDRTAREFLNQVRGLSMVYANPFTMLERKALEHALGKNEIDARAASLLGNYWSRLNTAQARKWWTRSIELEPENWIALRNLAYVTLRERRDIAGAVALYARALTFKSDSPDIIVEYIQALRLAGNLVQALNYLRSLKRPLVDDYRLVKQKAYLLCDLRQFAESIETWLTCHNLHVWEGETTHARYYQICCQALGLQALEKADFDTAEKWFKALFDHPEQLCKSRAYDENESLGHYHMGLLHEAMGHPGKARESFQKAVDQPFPHIHHWVSFRENEYYA
ncbi:MAG: DUF5107 domain-containing protein, partial [Kiritimatiellia bacterium]|nr:DUF5107 domain-containing protein [Kiritimatiellia bacterium]